MLIFSATFIDPIHVVKVDVSSPQLKLMRKFDEEKTNVTGNLSIVYNWENIVVGTIFVRVSGPFTLKKGRVTLIGVGAKVTCSLSKRNTTLQGSKSRVYIIHI